MAKSNGIFVNNEITSRDIKMLLFGIKGIFLNFLVLFAYLIKRFRQSKDITIVDALAQLPTDKTFAN